MRIVTSVRRLKELGTGTIVPIPENLLKSMAQYLKPQLLDSNEGKVRLVASPFYVLEAPTVARVVEESRSRRKCGRRQGRSRKR